MERVGGTRGRIVVSVIVLAVLVGGCRSGTSTATRPGSLARSSSGQSSASSLPSSSSTTTATTGRVATTIVDTHAGAAKGSPRSTSNPPAEPDSPQAGAPRPGAPSVTRTPPYDYGCLQGGACDDAEARRGDIRSRTTSAQPCVNYSPIDPADVCTENQSTAAGLRVEMVDRPSSIHISAVVRQVSSAPNAALRGCIDLSGHAGSWAGEVIECRYLPVDGSPATVTLSTDPSWLTPCTCAIYVSLLGDGAAHVDRIAYSFG